MPTFTDKLTCGTIAFFAAIFVSFGQASLPAPDSNPDQQTAAKAPSGPSTNPAKNADKSASAASPLTVVQATSTTSTPAAVKPAPPQPSTSTPATTTVPPVPADTVTESGGVGVREFQGDDVGQVLRLLGAPGQDQHGGQRSAVDRHGDDAVGRCHRSSGDRHHRESQRSVHG